MKKMLYLLLLFHIQTIVCWQWLNNLRAVHAYFDGDLESAQYMLDEALTEDANNYQAAYNRGKIAYAKKDFVGAQAYFEKATHVQGNKQLQLQAWFDAGNSLVQQKKYEEAIKSYQEVLNIDSNHLQSRDMIDQLKKLLEQQKQQEQDKQKNQQQQKNDQENNDDNQKNDQNDADNNDDSNDKSDQQNQDDLNSEQKKKEQNQHDSKQNEKKDSQDKCEQKEEDQKGAEDETNKSDGQDRTKPEKNPGRDNQSQNGEQNNKHDTPQQQQSSSNDGTQNQEKTQELGVDGNQDQSEPQSGETDKYAQLFAALDDRDAKISKDMLKANLKDKMPHKYGQKNW